ncbi:17-beta-hydroxysteroid dehydrogenase 13 [Halyomorpha halys]|uniref:17-beta-hydroxysteroid dehydrogenase 13 n=1 Tax=Halyomorpha halys TaxID=286706 RepID=UPI0006D5033C
MEFVIEGWENGPTAKRDLQKPAKLKKDHILFTAFGMVYFFCFIVWELAAGFGSFLWRLVFRPEPKSLKGRVCLVTGAGRGLGREFCLALAREGAVIACVDINEPNNKATAAIIKEMGGKAVPYTVNVVIKKDVEELVSRIEKELGPVYLLINNAAVVCPNSTIEEEFVRALFNVNLFGPIWLMNAVLPTMKLRNEGHIVNISSISSKMVFAPLSIYGSTKISLAYFGNCVRAELQLANKNGIFVSNVHPSVMNSSEDYVRCLDMKINVVVEMEDVVRATMDAIHYNYEEVIVPSYIKYFLILITEIMPSWTNTKLMRLMFQKWTLPNDKQKECLPWTDLVKKCSFPEKIKER